MNIKSVLNQKDAVSLLLLSRINFNAGLQMMKTLRIEEKRRQSKAEEDVWASADNSIKDEFEACAPQAQDIPKLDVNVNLILASAILAKEIEGEGLDFFKSNLRTPKAIIVQQMDWMADKQAQANLAIAQKMKVEVAVDKFLQVIKAKQANKLASYVTEAQSAADRYILTADTDTLIDLIEDTYENPHWKAELEDQAVSLYESAVKRLNEGKYADLPHEIVQLATTTIERKRAA